MSRASNCHASTANDDQYVEVLDPREPLFGRKLRLVSDGPNHVITADDREINYKIPRRATSLLPFVDASPAAKLTCVVVRELLALVKENELCPTHCSKSGPRSPRKTANALS
ncbi:MAG: hypothetical protein GY924_24025 [Planctomycetaceae bacterium]|nr:hypothetical protein [Planctomycetaceae bacterium]